MPEEKDVEFDAASFGVIGLETSVGVVINYLVAKDILKPSVMVEKMSLNPNRILGTAGGTLSVGAMADITIIDPDEQWTVDTRHFFSKSHNTAFEGFSLRGCALYTILGGRVVFQKNRSD